MKTTGRLLRLMAALAMLFSISACSDSKSDEIGKTTPKDPVSDDGWQIVPASGGTIEKDDMTIEFPSGTFSSDTKVTITKAKKGETFGKYEVSEAYKVTLPATLKKAIKVRIKGEKANDVSLFLMTRGFNISMLSDTDIESELETQYASGEYSTTLPAVDNGEDPGEAFFTIGLAHQPEGASQSTRSPIYGGTVKNVNYEVKIPIMTWLKYDSGTLDKLEQLSPKIRDWTKEALQKIFDLGFEIDASWTLNGKRNLFIYYVQGDDWGGFSQDWLWNDLSSVELGIGKLLNPKTTEADIKCTIIHELFHFVQSYYDPRVAFSKGRPFQTCGEELIMYEMGAVWSEHLMNNGQLNADFINKNLYVVTKDRLSITDAQELRNTYTPYEEFINDSYQDQGYGIAPMLYYLCSTKEMKDFKFDNTSILELHEIWKDQMKSNTFTVMNALDKWISINHDSSFLMGDMIDDYYLKLWKGELVKGFSISSYYHSENEKANKNPDHVYDNKTGLVLFKGNCPPYGCSIKMINLLDFKNKSLKDKEIVIKNLTEGMQTYLLVTDKSSKYTKFIQSKKSSREGDSIVVSGSTLEKLRLNGGDYDHSFYLVTTRTSNFYTDHGTKPYTVNVDFRDAPKELPNITVNNIIIQANNYKKVSFTRGSITAVTKSSAGYEITASSKGYDESGIIPEYGFKSIERSVKIFIGPSTNGKDFLGPVKSLDMKIKATDGEKDNNPVDFIYELKASNIPWNAPSYYVENGLYLWAGTVGDSDLTVERARYVLGDISDEENGDFSNKTGWSITVYLDGQ